MYTTSYEDNEFCSYSYEKSKSVAVPVLIKPKVHQACPNSTTLLDNERNGFSLSYYFQKNIYSDHWDQHLIECAGWKHLYIAVIFMKKI